MANSEKSKFKIPELLSGGLKTNDGQLVEYWPVEISPFSFAVLTEASFVLKDELILGNVEVCTKVRVSEVILNYRGSTYSWLNLVGTHANTNLEVILRYLPELRPWNPKPHVTEPIHLPIANLSLRSARFDTPIGLKVRARTFGFAGDVLLKTSNASQTGIYILEERSLAPFVKDTILELSIDIDCEFFAEPLSFLGKVVRTKKTEQSQFFAVKFIEADVPTKEKWSDYIFSLGRDLHLKD